MQTAVKPGQATLTASLTVGAIKGGLKGESGWIVRPREAGVIRARVVAGAVGIPNRGVRVQQLRHEGSQAVVHKVPNESNGLRPRALAGRVARLQHNRCPCYSSHQSASPYHVELHHGVHVPPLFGIALRNVL